MPLVPPETVTVSELNRLARSALEEAFPLLWVAGEISNLARAASGHVYFTLKDADAQVRCAMFRSRAQLVPWRLENGQQVEVRALVTLYEARGDFQLNVEAVRRAGVGRLYEAFLRLKEKLAAEGLFAEARKRPLPRFSARIGIVTSPKAAALHDVLVTLARRAPNVPVIIHPTPVQGAGAAAQIAAAIESVGVRGECDVLLLVRGGGSLEDLWSFNDEGVARAIAASLIPVVAGVGHETDVTIADLAADRRAPTPTAAAEIASAGWFDAAAEVRQLGADLKSAMRALMQRRMQRVDLLERRLVHPAQRLAQHRQKLDHLASRISAAAERIAARRRERLSVLRLRLSRGRPNLEARRTRVERLGAALAALNRAGALARGYALVLTTDGHLVRSHRQLTKGQPLELRFAEGGAGALVTRLIPD